MSYHKDERNTPSLKELLRLHGLDDEKPSQLADVFRLAYWHREAEIARLTAERDDAIRAKDCFQRMTRAHWEALCAMRNSINEYIQMPNTDSGPLFSPEDGPIYADIAERVIADLTESRAYALALEQELGDRARLTAERDAALAGWDDQKQRHHECWVESVKTLYRALDAEAELAAIQPGPDARQADLAKAWEMGRDAAAAWHTMQAETAMGALCCGSDNYEIRRAGRVSDMHRGHSEAIRALTPPADLAAKIGGE